MAGKTVASKLVSATTDARVVSERALPGSSSAFPHFPIALDVLGHVKVSGVRRDLPPPRQKKSGVRSPFRERAQNGITTLPRAKPPEMSLRFLSIAPARERLFGRRMHRPTCATRSSNSRPPSPICRYFLALGLGLPGKLGFIPEKKLFTQGSLCSSHRFDAACNERRSVEKDVPTLSSLGPRRFVVRTRGEAREHRQTIATAEAENQTGTVHWGRSYRPGPSSSAIKLNDYKLMCLKH